MQEAIIIVKHTDICGSIQWIRYKFQLELHHKTKCS